MAALWPASSCLRSGDSRGDGDADRRLELGGIRLYGWVTAGYLLASTVSVPVFGKLADLRGEAVARGGRSFLGRLGGERAFPEPDAAHRVRVVRAQRGLDGPAHDSGERPLFFQRARPGSGFFGSVWGISAVIGPLLGAIMKVLSWRWVFFVNVPIGIVAALLLIGHSTVGDPAQRTDTLEERDCPHAGIGVASDRR
jgi:MFS family permease